MRIGAFMTVIVGSLVFLESPRAHWNVVEKRSIVTTLARNPGLLHAATNSCIQPRSVKYFPWAGENYCCLNLILRTCGESIAVGGNALGIRVLC